MTKSTRHFGNQQNFQAPRFSKTVSINIFYQFIHSFTIFPNAKLRRSRGFEQFKIIAGLGSDDSSSDVDDKINRLLTIHDHDLNNAILTYLESGFETVESAQVNTQNDTGTSSAIDPRD